MYTKPRVVHRVGLVGKIFNRLVIALVDFPSNAIVVVEIEQSMSVLLLRTSLHSSGMDRPSSPSSLRQFATIRFWLHGSVLD
jgi:hypothetical protein